MRPPGPVVVDTSVHLSSEVFGTAGSPAKEVLARGFADHYEFAISEELLREIARKLIENAFPIDDVVDYLTKVRASASLFDDVEVTGITQRDPNDIFVVALARTSAAWCIVAQDGDLRDADTQPPGWSPGRFLARLRDLRGETEDQRFP